VTRAFVGLPLPTSAPGRCAYAPTIADPTCGAEPVTHIAVDSPGWGVAGLSTCAEHRPYALAAGELIGEHSWTMLCGPGCTFVVERD
jgi:hypothetical protein